MSNDRIILFSSSEAPPSLPRGYARSNAGPMQYPAPGPARIHPQDSPRTSHGSEFVLGAQATQPADIPTKRLLRQQRHYVLGEIWFSLHEP